MPASLRVVVERAIRARQRYSEWFRKSGVDKEYVDKQHCHFIEILEKALNILEPCVDIENADLKRTKPDENLSETVNLSNRFTILKIEESPEVDDPELSEVVAGMNVPAKTKASKGEPEVAVYEVQDEFDEELAFIIYCFFEDLHRTQDFVHDLWRKYKARECDLETAAVATNAAFDLVRPR